MSTNPAVSMPNADMSHRHQAVPFVAVSDIMARTDTGDLADVLLPATGWGEKDGTVTNSERRVSRQRAFLPAPGEHAPTGTSSVMWLRGWAGKTRFTYDYTRRHLCGICRALSQHRDFGRDLDLSIFADVDYANLIPTQWPQNDKRFFADGQFYHADGKARMLAITAPDVTDTTFMLNTGRNRDQWHTMTRTGKSPKLGGHLAEPYLEIHPRDANRIDVDAGDLITVENQFGKAILRVLVTDRVAVGRPFAPMHWTRQTARNATINSVVAPVLDPISGQPALKSGHVSLSKYEADWYGFIASRHPIIPNTSYAGIARTETGWQAEVACKGTPDDWAIMVQQMTGLQDAEVSIYQDSASGTTRVALSCEGVIEALMYTGEQPVVLSRSAATTHIGTSVQPLFALAGRTSADQPDPGITICACFNVGRNTLLDAIAVGATSADQLGEATCAGTNCGSCKPELNALIAQVSMPVAAE